MDEVLQLKNYWIEIPKSLLGRQLAVPPSPPCKLQSKTPDLPQNSYREGIIKSRPANIKDFSLNLQDEAKYKGRKTLNSRLLSTRKDNSSPQESKISSKSTINASLQRIFKNVSQADNLKASNAQRNQDSPKSHRGLLEKRSSLKAMAGKMFASELWGKKQHEEALTNSPTTARNVSLLQYRLGEKQTKTPINEISMKRKLKNEISDELIKKYNNGDKLSFDDITVQPPLYDQLVSQRERNSHRKLKIKLPNKESSRQDSLFSVRDTSFTSNENESRNNSKSPLLSLSREPSLPISLLLPKMNSRSARKQETKDRSSILDANFSIYKTRKTIETNNEQNLSVAKDQSLLLKLSRNTTTDDYYPSSLLQKQSSLALLDQVSKESENNKKGQFIIDSIQTVSLKNLDPIHHTLAHLDTIIDECNQLSKDQSLKRALSKFDNITYSEREKSDLKKNRRSKIQKKGFIEQYSHQVQARNKKS